MSFVAVMVAEAACFAISLYVLFCAALAFSVFFSCFFYYLLPLRTAVSQRAVVASATETFLEFIVTFCVNVPCFPAFRAIFCGFVWALAYVIRVFITMHTLIYGRESFGLYLARCDREREHLESSLSCEVDTG